MAIEGEEVIEEVEDQQTLRLFFPPNLGKCEYCNDLGEINTQCNNCTLKEYIMMSTYDYEYERRRTLPPEERIELDVLDSNDDDELYRFFRIIADIIDLPLRGKEYYMHLRLRLCKDLRVKTVQDLITKSYNMYCSDEIISENEISANEFSVILKYGALWLVNRYKRRGYDSNPDPNAVNNTSHSDDETWDTEEETTFEQDDSREVNQNNSNEETDSSNEEISLPVIEDIMMYATSRNKETDLWLGDTGASTHMTNNEDGMYDCKIINSNIKVGNGKNIKATKIGEKCVTVFQKDGTMTTIILHECKYVPDLWINLFSITKSLQHQWSLSSEGVNIVLTKGQSKIKFDHIMKTENGFVEYVKMSSACDLGNAAIQTKNGIDINEFHKQMGHINEDALKQTARLYNIRLVGVFNTCYECSISKIKQRNVKQVTGNKSMISGERLFIDSSSIDTVSYGGAKYWLLVVDDYSDYCFSIFL